MAGRIPNDRVDDKQGARSYWKRLIVIPHTVALTGTYHNLLRMWADV